MLPAPGQPVEAGARLGSPWGTGGASRSHFRNGKGFHGDEGSSSSSPESSLALTSNGS